MPYDVIDVSGGDGWVIAVLKRWLRLDGVVICRSHGWEHEDYRIRVSAGDGSVRWKRGLLMRVARLPMVAISAKRSDAIIVGSSPVRAFAVTQRWKSTSRIFVIPCGLDSAYLTADHAVERKGLLYVGSWLDRKGVVYLARAYELLCHQGYEIPLSVVGYGCATEEVLRTFDQSIRARIRIGESLRIVDEQHLIREYQSHQILVFPSLYEGFGMVFLEAMASGLAVIASPVGGVSDLIRHEQNGIIVPPGDPVALAQAIADLWRSPEKINRLGSAGREGSPHYTWEMITKQTLECYRMIRGDTVDNRFGKA
jgi:phosphatidyl-myo-inositol dimannoside synthase